MKMKYTISLAFILFFATIYNSRSNDITLNFENWTTDSLGLAPEQWYGVVGGGFVQNNIPLPVTRSSNSIRNNYAMHATPQHHGSSIYLTLPRNYTRADTVVNQVTSNPDSLVGYIEHNVGIGDNAGIVVHQMDDQGNMLEEDIMFFLGQTSGIERMTLALTPVAGVVDHVNLILVASVTGNDNSYVLVDELEVKSGHNTELFYDFEVWEPIFAPKPDGWTTSNMSWATDRVQHIQQTQDADQHTSAMYMLGEVYDGSLTAIAIKNIPVLNTPDEISGSYKFSSPGSGRAFFRVIATAWNGSSRDTLSAYEFTLGESANYSHFSEGLPFSGLTTTPDTIRLTIIPNNMTQPSVYRGNELYLDHITIGFPDPPMDEPVLYAPENFAVDVGTMPELTWYETEFADSYHLQLADNSSFNNPVVNQVGITDTNYTVPPGNLQKNSTYYWRVRAVNQDGNSGWSDEWEFDTETEAPAAVELHYPENTSQDVHIMTTLIWKHTEYADAYHLELSESSDFSGPLVIDEPSLSDSFYVVGDGVLEYETTYHWRVRAISDAGGAGNWSTVWTFETEEEPLQPPEQVALISPADMSEDVSLTTEFTWNEVADAENYLLEVSENSNFDELVIDESELTETEFQVNEGVFDYETTYYWRVRAENEAGTGDWSAVWSFNTLEEHIEPPSIPLLISPENESNNQPLEVLFEWHDADNAETYHLFVSDEADFSNTIIDEDNLPDTEFQLTEGVLEAETTYYWRVRAYNEGGYSDWSDTWSFETEEGTYINLPELTSNSVNIYPNPATNQTIVQVTLSESKEVKISVFDLNGRIIEMVAENAYHPNGTHDFNFNMSDYEPGLYIVKVKLGDEIVRGRLMVR